MVVAVFYTMQYLRQILIKPFFWKIYIKIKISTQKHHTIPIYLFFVKYDRKVSQVKCQTCQALKIVCTVEIAKNSSNISLELLVSLYGFWQP